MVTHGWIEDDNMVNMIPVFKSYEYDKENPGVIIEILKNNQNGKKRKCKNYIKDEA